MTPERAAEILGVFYRPEGENLLIKAILAACAEERRAALTEAADLMERTPNHSLHDAIRDLRDRESKP